MRLVDLGIRALSATVGMEKDAAMESDVMESTKVFDFVVVGSGGGSLCAALAARANGKSVLILEKTALVGGTTSRSGGAMWIPNNRFLRQAGVDDSPEKALTYMNAAIGDGPDMLGSTPERRVRYIDQAPKMLDFLLEQGIRIRRYPYWPDYHDELPGGMATGRVCIAEMFNTTELGQHKDLLRPSFAAIPADLEDFIAAPLARRTWKGRLTTLRIGWRMFVSRLLGKSWVGGGAALQGRLFKRALEVGADIRINAAVERLVSDESGRVTGVVARIDGRKVAFGSALGVLVNAGGFSRNQAMRDKYMPGTRADWSLVCEGDTGEMIEEMVRLGAATSQMDEMVGEAISLSPEPREIHPIVMPELAKPHSIVVDQSGQRYARETQSYQAYIRAIYARDKTVPAIPSWQVMDSEYVANFMVCETMPWEPVPQKWIDAGFIKKADTLAELAGLCGMEPDQLTASVERFNRFARNGKDEDFGRGDSAYDNFYADPTNKPVPALGAIAKAPFYAMPVYPGDIGTTGGAVTDIHARVLREDGSPIPGLYATGNSTASVMGRAYPGGGACVGPSMLWGYVAAVHATSQ